MYREPSGTGRAELEIKKSRFIGTARRIQSPQEAKEWVTREREAHPGARHVVHAFLIGPPNSEVAGMHDDGEPKGTSGRPVLDAIRGSGIRNVLVTITRYFGGTKLGTGGLVRAYGDCARLALENTPTVEVRAELPCRMTLPYEFYDSLVRFLDSRGCRREGEDFQEEVSLIVHLPEDGYDRCLEAIQDLCRGRCRIDPLEAIDP
ncbi:MAG: YigZ family protein [Spirochaetales bacterium]